MNRLASFLLGALLLVGITLLGAGSTVAKASERYYNNYRQTAYWHHHHKHHHHHHYRWH